MKNPAPFLRRLRQRLMLLFPLKKPRFRRNFDSLPGPPQKILLMPPTGIGDHIMAATAIQALRERYPEAQIHLLTHFHRGNDQLAELMPAIDKAIDMRLPGYRFGSVVFLFSLFFPLMMRLKFSRYDLAVAFMPTFVLRGVLLVLGAPFWIYGNRFDDYPGRIAADLLKFADVTEPPKLPVFNVPEPSTERAAEILPKSLGGVLVGLHPLAGFEWKAWKQFDRLQDALLARGITPILVGKGDYPAGRPGAYNLINQLTLAELFWVINRLNCFVTSDSGPMHIAFAMNVPTVALFGFISPAWLTPPDPDHLHRILYIPTRDSEKTRKMPKKSIELDNLQAITVEQVLTAIDEILSRPQK